MLVLRTPVASFLAQIDVARESVIMLYCILCTSSYNVFYVYIGACIAQSPYPIDTSVFPLHFVRRPRPFPLCSEEFQLFMDSIHIALFVVEFDFYGIELHSLHNFPLKLQFQRITLSTVVAHTHTQKMNPNQN